MSVRSLRIQVVTMMVLVLSMISSATVWAMDPQPPTPIFPDIVGSPYESAIRRMAAQGIVKGFPDDTFHPDELVTRAQMAVFINRLVGADTAPTSCRYDSFDYELVYLHWACKSIERVKEWKFMTGDQGRFRPDDPISHAEAVTALLRAAGWEQEIKGPWPVRVGNVALGLGLPINGFDTETLLTRGQAARLVDDILTRAWHGGSTADGYHLVQNHASWQGKPVSVKGIAFETVETGVGKLHFASSVPEKTRQNAVGLLYQAVSHVRRQFLLAEDSSASADADVYIVSDDEWAVLEPGNAGAFYHHPDADMPEGIYMPMTRLEVPSALRSLAHEYTHMVAAHLAGFGEYAPAWFIEGLAIAMEYSTPDGSGLFDLHKERIAQADKNGKLMRLPTKYKDWEALSGEKQGLAYSESGLLMVNLLPDSHRLEGMTDILQRLRAGHSLNEAWQFVFGEDLDAQFKQAFSSLSSAELSRP